MSEATVIVIAKEPRPGHAKTRLTPPFTLREGAELAAAALADTLEAVSLSPAARRVVALDGRAGAWLPEGFEVIAQRRGGLGARLAGAFEDVGGPALLVGMDTPQLTPVLIADALSRLAEEGVDAVLGPAADGGFWAIGLTRSDRAVFAGVPMSSSRTGEAQRRRLDQLRFETRELVELRDVDNADDARVVASLAPCSRFAAALADCVAVVA